MKEINQRILDAINKQLPQNQKIVTYLAEVLDLSKESVYRRIRGEIAFSIDELLKVASNLNLSIDEILNHASNKQNCFDIPADFSSNPTHALIQNLQLNNAFAKEVTEAQNSEIIIAFNRLSLIIHMRLKHVFKFLYYKYLSQTNNVPLNYKLSDLVLPHEVDSLRDEYFYYSQKINHVTYIIDQNTLARFIKEVLYYFNRKLLSKDELHLIQKDLYELIDITYYMTINGTNKLGARTDIYLSFFDINSTSSYLRYDDKRMVKLWINTVTPLNIYSPEIVDVQKNWFLSLKKQSTLITQSNEIQQTEYLNKQRAIIDDMTAEK